MLFIITALFLFVSSLEAVQVEFEASVDRTRVAQSEALLLTLRIVSDENLQHMPAPTLALGDFHVEGPSVSSRIEMVNFTTSYTRELTYRLYAKRQGRIRIGAASIEIDGKTYRTRPIDIEVLRAGQRSGRARPRPTERSSSGAPSPPSLSAVRRTSQERSVAMPLKDEDRRSSSFRRLPCAAVVRQKASQSRWPNVRAIELAPLPRCSMLFRLF